MNELFNAEAVTYASVWLVGAMASLAVTLRDSSYRDFWRSVGAVACGGFIAFSVVGIVGAHIGGHFGSRGYSLAVASVVGLSGKSIDYWIRALATIATRVKLPEIEQTTASDQKADR